MPTFFICLKERRHSREEGHGSSANTSRSSSVDLDGHEDLEEEEEGTDLDALLPPKRIKTSKGMFH